MARNVRAKQNDDRIRSWRDCHGSTRLCSMPPLRSRNMAIRTWSSRFELVPCLTLVLMVPIRSIWKYSAYDSSSPHISAWWKDNPKFLYGYYSDIKRAARKQFSYEEKNRIMLDGWYAWPRQPCLAVPLQMFWTHKLCYQPLLLFTVA